MDAVDAAKVTLLKIFLGIKLDLVTDEITLKDLLFTDNLNLQIIVFKLSCCTVCIF